MAIDPSKITFGKKPLTPVTPTVPKVSEPIELEKLPEEMSSPPMPFSEEGFSIHSQLELFRKDLAFNLKDFETFLKNPGKYRLQSRRGYYVNPGYGVYFMKDGKEHRVNLTRLFAVYLIAKMVIIAI